MTSFIHEFVYFTKRLNAKHDECHGNHNMQKLQNKVVTKAQ